MTSPVGEITACFSLICEQSAKAEEDAVFAVSYPTALKDVLSLDVTWVI